MYYAGVQSVNGKEGAVTIEAADNSVSIENKGSHIMIKANGGAEGQVTSVNNLIDDIEIRGTHDVYVTKYGQNINIDCVAGYKSGNLTVSGILFANEIVYIEDGQYRNLITATPGLNNFINIGNYRERLLFQQIYDGPSAKNFLVTCYDNRGNYYHDTVAFTSDVTAVSTRIDSLEQRGHFAGSFSNFASIPTDTSQF